MQQDTNRKLEREREAADIEGSIDSARAVGNAIRQAFLTHMDEQQRQFSMSLNARRPGGDTRKR